MRVSDYYGWRDSRRSEVWLRAIRVGCAILLALALWWVSVSERYEARWFPHAAQVRAEAGR